MTIRIRIRPNVSSRVRNTSEYLTPPPGHILAVSALASAPLMARDTDCPETSNIKWCTDYHTDHITNNHSDYHTNQITSHCIESNTDSHTNYHADHCAECASNQH